MVREEDDGVTTRLCALGEKGKWENGEKEKDLERFAIACVPCVGAILVSALGGRGQGEYTIRPYQETEDTAE